MEKLLQWPFLAIFSLLSLAPLVCESYRSLDKTLCIRVGAVNETDTSSSYSLGMSNFLSNWLTRELYFAKSEYDPFEYNLYGVSYRIPGGNEEIWLSNWVHIVLKSKFVLYKFGAVMIDAYQMNEKGDKTILTGEFLSGNPCRLSDEGNSTSTVNPLQILPCAGAGDSAPLLPTGYIHISDYVDDWEKRGQGICKEGPVNEIHTVFKFSDTPCNHPKKLVIRSVVLVRYVYGTATLAGGPGKRKKRRKRDDDDPFAYTSYKPDVRAFAMTIHVKNRISGAADVLPPGVKVDCSRKLELAPWVEKVEKSEEVNSQGYYEQVSACNSNPLVTPSQIGRCGSSAPSGIVKPIINSQDDFAPACEPLSAKASKLLDESTTKYFKRVENYTKNCDCKKVIEEMVEERFPLGNEPKYPEDPTTTELFSSSTTTAPITTTESSDTNALQDIIGVSVKSDYGKIVWNARQSHGMVMTVAVTFLIPTSIFLSRYYKESFTNVKTFLFLPIALFTHLQGIFLTTAALIAGLGAFGGTRHVYGTNLSSTAQFHGGVGWLTIIICFVMTCVGGYRAKNEKFRIFLIAAHSLTGFIVYFLTWVISFTSIFIQSSPSTMRDSVMYDSRSDKLVSGSQSIPVVGIMLIFWLIFDVVMHVLSTARMMKMNAILAAKVHPRAMNLVFVPILPDMDSGDINNTSTSRCTLYLYVTIAGITTFVIILLILVSPTENRGFGPMSCTHDPITLKIRGELDSYCVYNTFTLY